MVRGDREARVELGEDNLIGGRSGEPEAKMTRQYFPLLYDLIEWR